MRERESESLAAVSRGTLRKGWLSQRLGVDLRGGGLFVDGLLAKVVAALIFLLHAIDEQENEEH